MSFPYSISKTCFITGHRPQSIGAGWDDHKAHNLCKNALKRLLLKALQRGYRYFISGMALGTDLWAAELVLYDPELVENGAQLIAAVPFHGQEKWWKDKDVLELYQKILMEAHDSYLISLELSDSEEKKASMEQKNWASYMLLQRNQWMVDRASLGIGVYDGKKSGGTYRTVEYALKHQRMVCTYNPVTHQYERQDTQISLVN